MPLKIRATISPLARRDSTARNDRSASARSSSSASTYLPFLRSSRPSSSVLVLPLSLSVSAFTAASRVAWSVLESWIDACVSTSRPLISGSDSLAIAAEIAGSASSSAVLCSSFAAARRVARSGVASFSAASAVPSSRAHPVVDDEVVEVVGYRRDGLAGQKIGGGVTLDLKNAVLARGLDFAVQHRLQERQGLCVAARDDRGDRLAARIALAEREIANCLGRDGGAGLRRPDKRGHGGEPPKSGGDASVQCVQWVPFR